MALKLQEMLTFFFMMALSLIIGLMGILADFIFHPVLFFRRTRRETPPECLLDQSLGTHEYVQANGIKFHYVTSGDKSKPLMLFIHGFPEFWYSWRHQIKEFAQNYHVVAIDLRGYGETDRPPHVEDYKVSNIRQDIAELIPALGHSTAILVAHDWGGAIAWTVTQKHPDLVEKLVVLNCPHGRVMSKRLRKWSQMMKSWYMFLFQYPYLPEYLLSVRDFGAFDGLAVMAFNKSAFTKEDIEAYKYTFSQPGAFTPPLNYYRAAFRQREKPPTGLIEVPTLLIWGDNDTAFDLAMADEHSEGIATNITIKHIPKCSHFVQLDQPEKVNEYMKEFLEKEFD